MATLTHSITDTAPQTMHETAHGLSTLAARFRAAWAERRARSRTMRDLHACDARDLRDLGISKYDFQAIADGTFRR